MATEKLTSHGGHGVATVDFIGAEKFEPEQGFWAADDGQDDFRLFDFPGESPWCTIVRHVLSGIKTAITQYDRDMGGSQTVDWDFSGVQATIHDGKTIELRGVRYASTAHGDNSNPIFVRWTGPSDKYSPYHRLANTTDPDIIALKTTMADLLAGGDPRVRRSNRSGEIIFNAIVFPRYHADGSWWSWENLSPDLYPAYAREQLEYLLATDIRRTEICSRNWNAKREGDTDE